MIAKIPINPRSPTIECASKRLAAIFIPERIRYAACQGTTQRVLSTRNFARDFISHRE
jgi:hypothetical protein